MPSAVDVYTPAGRPGERPIAVVLLGVVFAQSSSLWWTGGPLTGDAVFAAAAERRGHTTRFALDTGALESLTLGNRRLFEAMAAQGYQVNLNEYQGGHDFACWRGGLAEGLVSMLGGRNYVADA